MPRPTPAQLAYGSVTVIGSTLAMLLLSQATSGPGVVAIALAGLALGVMVAVTVAAPVRRSSRPARTAGTPVAEPAHHHGSAAHRPLSEHSLHR